MIERGQNAGQPVLNAGSSSPGTQQGYVARQKAHQKLREVPSWMTLGTPQDSLYTGFYIINDISNVGLFRNFEDMAAVDSLSTAGSILTSIVDTNLSESNLKVVYSIYHQTWMQGVYDFSSADSVTLYDIAVQHASDAGEAVYAARVMLGIEVDGGGASAERFGSFDELAGERSMTLYPNPATDKVSVNTSLEDEQIGIVQITDVHGKVVFTQTAIGGTPTTIEVSTLDNGLYFVQLIVDGKLVGTTKLEVIHE